jgi:hypothetical protein
MKSVIVRRIGNLARTGSSLSAIAMAGLAAGVVVAPTAAFAQTATATATLRGRAPAGAEVVATETSTGSVRRTTAGTDGTYVIAGLPSGNYQVTAGDRSAVVAVAVPSTAVLDLALGGAVRILCDHRRGPGQPRRATARAAAGVAHCLSAVRANRR